MRELSRRIHENIEGVFVPLPPPRPNDSVRTIASKHRLTKWESSYVIAA